MWSHYGDRGCGVCLKTSVRRLQESLLAKPPFFPQIHKVSYLPEQVPIPTVISSLAACRKRPEFAHEKEFRIVLELGFDQCPKDAAGALLPPDYHMVPVDLDRLIETVVVGPDARGTLFEELEALVKTVGLTPLVRKSQLASWH